MIKYHYEFPFKLEGQDKYTEWIINVLERNGVRLGAIQYIFCSDDYLLDLNQRHLGHEYFTDVITFGYEKDPVSADIFISVERVSENADSLGTTREEEMRRVMIHGILHLIGYDDKDEEGRLEMRRKEEEYMEMFHVKQ